MSAQRPLWGLTVCLFLVCVQQARAEDTVALLQALIRAAYPELQGALHVKITTSGPFAGEWIRFNDARLEVRPAGPVVGSVRPNADPELTLTATVSNFGRLVEMRSTGRYVASDEIKEVVGNARGWTEPRIARELKKRGARYPPDFRDDFVRALNLAALEPFIGTITRHEVLFSVDRDGNDPRAVSAIEWRVEVETKDQTGQRDGYILLYEPFYGRLVYLTRRALL